MVKTLVFLMLFFAFLEMLLPMKEGRKFVQVIVGLFVMVTILSPLVSLLGRDFSFSLNPATSLPEEEELRTILTQGKHLQETATRVAYEQCEQRIEKQVETVACSVPGVASADAEVHLLDTGGIEKVLLRIELEEGENCCAVEPVAEVRVREGEEQEKIEKFRDNSSAVRIFFQVRSQVASICGLPPEKVVVTSLNTREVKTGE
ncbi:MAG: Stage III sporulation protein AF [Thermoanaerobacterales bacterium 50_218]|nr:MAG: Stage III sporulation protein AF [Thermoanaerobacterales bacterium 50_218]